MMSHFTIASPGDNNEVKNILLYLINNPQPSYLRLENAEKEYTSNNKKLIPEMVSIKIK